MVKKNSLSYLVLLSLEKGIEANVTLLDFLSEPYRYAWTGYRKKLNYGTLHKTIKSLREKGYVKTAKNEGKIILKLTQKGKQHFIIEKLLENEKWDGKWRIVVFDIPEKHRRLRNSLRSKLRQWQFTPWQKSVWISKKNTAKPLREFIKEIGLFEWVKVIVATEID